MPGSLPELEPRLTGAALSELREGTRAGRRELTDA